MNASVQPRRPAWVQALLWVTLGVFLWLFLRELYMIGEAWFSRGPR